MSDSRTDTRIVEIVYAYDPATDGPNLQEIGKQYTLPRKEARDWVNSGRARYADVPRDASGRNLADLNSRAVLNELRRLGLPELPNESKSDMVARIHAHQAEQQVAEQVADLEGLTVKELREQYQAAADMPANTKKADLIQAIRDAEASAQDGTVQTDPDVEVDASGGSTAGGIVTVAPGAEHNPDRDQQTDNVP